MTYKWFADISHYNKLPAAQMSELVQHGCVGFVIKAGQGTAFEDVAVATHVQTCKSIGAPYGLYHWPDPIKGNAIAQARFAIELAKKYEARFICPDIEQYWKDWEEWYNIVVMHQPGTLRIFTPEQLTRFYTDYLRELKTININETKLPLMSYSAAWFINAYCRSLAPVIRDYSDDYWNAAYIQWKQLDQDHNVSWEEFNLTLDTLVVPIKYMPNGITKWTAWQFALMPRPGFGELDCDIITEEGAAKYFGTDPIVPPDPEPEPEPIPVPVPSSFQMEVICEALNIRSGPGGNYKDLGDLHKGDILNVINVFGSPLWIEYEPGKFCCMKNSDGTYLKKVEPLV
jgi:hypothetical protein